MRSTTYLAESSSRMIISVIATGDCRRFSAHYPRAAIASLFPVIVTSIWIPIAVRALFIAAAVTR